MKARITKTSLMLVFLAQSLLAGGPGVFDFLRIPMSARASALGNTFLTMRDDPATMFSTPGLISTVPSQAVSIGFVKYLMDINGGFAAYTYQSDDLGWFGGGVTYMNYGSFDRRDRFSNDLGTFGAADLAVNAVYANVYENLHYGGSVKFIYSGIDQWTATGIAVDAGVAYVIPDEQLVFALSILNLGTQLSSYGSDRESIATDLKLGIGKKLEHLPLNLMLNFHKLNDNEDRFKAFSLGGEFTLSEVLRARIGYNHEMRQELKTGSSAGLAGFSAGFGLAISNYSFDYAFNSFGNIGALHRIGLGTRF